MCSYVSDWSLSQICNNVVKVYIIENIILYVTYIGYIIKKYLMKSCLPTDLYDNIIFKIISKILKDVYVLLLENYCL